MDTEDKIIAALLLTIFVAFVLPAALIVWSYAIVAVVGP